MDTALRLQFRYSEQDFVRGVRAHFASNSRVWLKLALTVVLAGLGCYVFQSMQDLRWFGAAIVSTAAFVVLVIAAKFFIIPQRLFRGEPRLKDERSLTFTSDGIHIQTAHVDSQLEWSTYSRALIDSHSFILYYGVRSFTVIPKRVFRDAEQKRVFEELLSQKIPKIVRK